MGSLAMPDDTLEPIDVGISTGGILAVSAVLSPPAWFWRCVATAVVVAALALVVLAGATVANWTVNRHWGREEVCLTRVSVSRSDPPTDAPLRTAASCR